MLDDGLRNTGPRSLPAVPGAAVPEHGDEPGYGSPAGRWRERLAAATVAGQLAQRLLAAPRSERLAMIAADPAYRRDSLALLLALAAEERLEGPPQPAEEYAEAALAVAIALPPAAGGNPRRLQALAAWLLGKAQLRGGRLEAAESSLERACRAAAGAGAQEQALAVAGLAQLRWQQRLPEQAVALLAVAGRHYADLHDRAGVAACRSLCGFLLLGAGEPMLGRLELRAAHRDLDRAAAPSLAVLVSLGIAHCEAWLDGTAAPDFLALADDSAAKASPVPPLPLGRWWHAVLGLGAAEPRRTDAASDAARREALAGGDLDRALRITLDQAMGRIAAGRAESVGALAAAVAAASPEAASPWAEEIAGLAELALARRDAYPAAARVLALRIAVRDVARLGARGLPWGLCELADRLLRHRRENEDPIGAAAL
jgi:hypothetical protein